MDFGISLDPSSVPQRHALYDSDEEEGDETEIQQPELVFAPPTQDITQSNTLVVAVETTACLFVRSHFMLTPLCSLEGSTQAVFKGTYFPKSGDKRCVVSEVVRADGGGEVVICLHERSVKSEHINAWAKMVN